MKQEEKPAADQFFSSLLGLSHSSEEKLAKLLVEWSSKGDEWCMQKSRIKLAITQEEIAEMLGTSRETVTRVFADLRRRQIVLRQGASLVIRNKSLLKELADIHEPSNPRA
jgi:CRP/FNR family transcriptional regulator, cyclic AMP receptor protein